MQSDGGLVDFRRFSGLRAILSGPAGGVVGYAQTSFDKDKGKPIIGFDMGGTSTGTFRSKPSSSIELVSLHIYTNRRLTIRGCV
jgi:N-methylhydantoinase A/oxoprolinase/acetone carboxylase beta subunit